MITVLIKSPGKKPQVTEINPSLHVFRQIVGGDIEPVSIDVSGIAFYCNEFGKIQGHDPNFHLTMPDGTIIDIVCGTVVFFRVNDMGEEVSLSADDIEYTKKWLIARSIRKTVRRRVSQ